MTSLVATVFEVIEKRQQERDVRNAILTGAERVRAILTLLAEDVEIVYAWRRDKLRIVLDARIQEYEKRLPTLTVQERWSVLQEIEAVASELETFESSKPIELIQSQRDAFEALVAFAQFRDWPFMSLVLIGLAPKHTTGRREWGPCSTAKLTHGIVRSQPDRHNVAYPLHRSPRLVRYA